MKKTKAKGKTTVKKTAKKVKSVTAKKQLDPAKVREEIAGIVKAGAKGITKAVMVQAAQGQLAPAKYLLEMAGVYPLSTDESPTSKEEESLAETLLDRLNIPKHPVVHDELQKEEDEDVVVIQPKKEVAVDSEESSEDEEEKIETVRVH
jgi:hypothetical protein